MHSLRVTCYTVMQWAIRAFDTLFPLYYELLLYIYHTQLDKATEYIYEKTLTDGSKELFLAKVLTGDSY